MSDESGAREESGEAGSVGAGSRRPNDGVSDDADRPLRERSIRSFVLRQGRLTEAQSRAFEQHWSRFGLDYAGVPRDFAQAFGRDAPRVLEIGFGNGEQLHWDATRDPTRDFIGCEVHKPGVGRLLNAVAADDVRNVRVYRHDAVEVLQHEIADGTLDQVRIYFPDPWPKKRQNKRRIVQPAFVALVATKLRAGGLLHLATDWQPYAAHMLEVMRASPSFANLADDYSPAPEWRRETHFEKRGRKLGHDVFDLVFQKKA